MPFITLNEYWSFLFEIKMLEFPHVIIEKMILKLVILLLAVCSKYSCQAILYDRRTDRVCVDCGGLNLLAIELYQQPITFCFEPERYVSSSKNFSKTYRV